MLAFGWPSIGKETEREKSELRFLTSDFVVRLEIYIMFFFERATKMRACDFIGPVNYKLTLGKINFFLLCITLLLTTTVKQGQVLLKKGIKRFFLGVSFDKKAMPLCLDGVSQLFNYYCKILPSWESDSHSDILIPALGPLLPSIFHSYVH
jgi:hypothetical protein